MAELDRSFRMKRNKIYTTISYKTRTINVIRVSNTKFTLEIITNPNSDKQSCQKFDKYTWESPSRVLNAGRHYIDHKELLL